MNLKMSKHYGGEALLLHQIENGITVIIIYGIMTKERIFNYDYKGKWIKSKTDREIKPEEIYVWQCKWCDKIVNSSQKPGDAPGSCIASKRTTIAGILDADYMLHEYDGNRHKWINIGRAN